MCGPEIVVRIRVQGVQQVAACLRAEPRLPDEVLSVDTWFQLVYSLVRFPVAVERSCDPCSHACSHTLQR